MRVWGVLGMLVLGACVPQVPSPEDQYLVAVPDLPPGFPPRIGSVAADLGGQPVVWDTYDYSIGAFDAAVQLMDWNGEVRFRLSGDPQGKPSSEAGVLVMTGVSAGKMATGPLTNVLIEIMQGDDWRGPRLSSAGQAAEVVLDGVTDKGDGAYGHATGHFSATLCAATGEPVVVDTSKCRAISGTFDTDLQFSNL